MSALDISLASDVPVPTVYRALTRPSYGLSVSRVGRLIVSKKAEETHNKIKLLYAKKVGSLFSEEVEELFNLRDELLKKHSDKVFSKMVDNLLLPVLKGHHEYGCDSLDSVRLSWLEAELYWAQMKLGMEKVNRQRVKVTFEMALDTLDSCNVAPSMEKLKSINSFKLTHNIVAALRDSLPGDHSPDQDDSVFRRLNYLSKAKNALDNQPWNWQLARGGLVVASLLQEMNEAKQFHQTLVQIDPKFKSFDHKPSKVLPSLSEDPDLIFFRTNFIEGA